MLLLCACFLPLLALLAWGPGHHLEFAERVWRRRREWLSADRAKVLSSERNAYLYGNLAADIINMKAYGGHHNHCHRWTIVDEMREHADTAQEEAFVLGYLSHLAADTIAHNHFVPFHLTRYARARGLGHLYWEMSADRFIAESRWDLVTRLKDEPGLSELDELVNATVPKKLLSMRTNKLLFNHVLLISERKSWRRGVNALHPREKVALKRGFLSTFQKAATERVRLALSARNLEALAHIDTTGKAAQKRAMQLRKQLVTRYPAGPERDAAAQEHAREFLVGMQSPPPRNGSLTPYWN